MRVNDLRYDSIIFLFFCIISITRFICIIFAYISIYIVYIHLFIDTQITKMHMINDLFLMRILNARVELRFSCIQILYIVDNVQ